MNLDFCPDGFHSSECPCCGLTAKQRDGFANETNSAVNYGDGVAAERARITARVRELEPCCADAAVVLSDGREWKAMCQCGAYVSDAVLSALAGEDR